MRKPIPSRHQKNQSRPQGASRAQAGRSQGANQSATDIPKHWRAVVGTHAIAEALKVHSKQCEKLWVRQTWESSEDLREFVERAKQLRIVVEFKSDGAIDRVASSHQGAVLYVNSAPEFNIEKVTSSKEQSIVLMLDGLEDPHNLGAILRTSWLVGADAVITPEDRAVGLTPIAHKVACGGVEHVPVEQVNNFSRIGEELKEKGYWIYGLSHKAEKTIFDLDLPDRVVWAIGAEDKGLRVGTERLCDELVKIPQVSAGASYNASVAAAMALSETQRQLAQRAKNKKR